VRVLVTGATGLVGCNVVRALLDAGYDVRAGIRDASNLLGLQDLNVETVHVNLTDATTVRAAVDGSEAVIHAGAAVGAGETGRAWMEAVNVGGTRSVCEAAAEARIPMVHVSSVDALGIRSWEHPADEDVAPNMAFLGSPYVDTKCAAESEVLAFVTRGLHAVIVNPTYMIGPWDIRPSSGEMILEVARRRGLFPTRGGNNFVDVRDVSAAIVQALEKGVVGRRYILGNENLTYWDAWTRMARVVEVTPPLMHAPYPAAWAAGQAGRLWGRWSGVEPSINPLSVALGHLPHYFDPSRAREELGLKASDLDRAIADAWQWFRTHGYWR
jgi:dihydroflavonol-4-reductase